MTIREMQKVLDARFLYGEEMADLEAQFVFSSDMMSDVLAFVKDQSVLLTGLVNPQVVRTADMMDMLCIVFVRGKEPDQMMINLAQSRGIVLMNTSLRMFDACGALWDSGLRGGHKSDE